MTYSRFVVKNAFRNKRRTALTVLSIGFSLLLLIVLRTFLDSLMNPPTSSGSVLRVAVQNAISLAGNLPFAYQQKLEAIPHVEMVMPLQWYGGQYIEPKNFFPNFACDPAKLWSMYPEFETTEETKKAFLDERIACVVGEHLMKRFDWKVGQRITLKGAIFPADLELLIVGSYKDELMGDVLFFRMDYMDESLGKPGTVGTFWLKADSPEAIPGIIETVDAMFRNTPNETKTQTEKAFQLGFTSMLGNVKVLIGSIVMVVVFTMLLVTASTMAMTIRERIREVAILKSIGYTRRIVLTLILGEAVFIAFLGGVVGCLVAKAMKFINFADATLGFVRDFNASPETLVLALGIGAAIGFISGLFPALQASNMKITEAMRRME